MSARQLLQDLSAHVWNRTDAADEDIIDRMEKCIRDSIPTAERLAVLEARVTKALTACQCVTTDPACGGTFAAETATEIAAILKGDDQ